MARRLFVLLPLVAGACNAFVPPQQSQYRIRSTQRTSSRAREQQGGLKMEADWGRVTVVDVKPAAEGLFHVHVDAGDLLSTYQVPGQYVQLKPHAPGSKPSFFAIASPPSSKGGGLAEFLIKRTDGTNWICDAKAGEVLDMTPAMGKGYQTQSFDNNGINHVMFLAAGSGIAPIRAAIESDALGLAKLSRTARLYFGVRTPAHLCYKERFDSWRELGVEVLPVYSRSPVPLNSAGYWGYIQQAVAGDEVRQPSKTGSLLCGMKEMTSLSTNILIEKGVAPENILLNF